MQCVERGLIKLDDPISTFLPEWKEPMIVTGFDEKDGGKPVLVEAKNAITLRFVNFCNMRKRQGDR